MLYTDKTCREFVENTAGKTPVPGGGSVSALVGALGAALGRMVGSLTLGKKKYADVQAEMLELVHEADSLQAELLELVQADIDIFRPLSELYGMKAETDIEKENKAALLEEALENVQCSDQHNGKMRQGYRAFEGIRCQRLQAGGERCGSQRDNLQVGASGGKPERVHKHGIDDEQKAR